MLGETTEGLLYELQCQRFDRHVDRETGEISDTPRYSTMSLPVGLAWGRLFGFRHEGKAWLRAELSLPKMLHGHNCNALDRDLLPDAVDAALTLLADEWPDIPDLEQIRVQRLDLTRDFHGVQSLATTLTAFSSRHIAHARYHEAWYRPDGTMQSLTRGSKSAYLVRAYDKSHELYDAARRQPDDRELLAAWASASGGQLRFELQLRAPLLRRMGLTRLGDLTPEALNMLAREYFHRAGWDTSYGGRARVQRTLEELRPTLSAADYRNLCCYIFCTERVMEVPLSRNVLDRVRPLARRHHLLDPDDERAPRRLDFDAGREVVTE